MENSYYLQFGSVLFFTINNEVRANGPEEHLARGQICPGMTAVWPLSQIVEGREKLIDQFFGCDDTFTFNEFLNREQILNCEFGKFIGRHGWLFPTAVAQAAFGLFCLDRLPFIQLAKAQINLRPNFR